MTKIIHHFILNLAQDLGRERKAVHMRDTGLRQHGDRFIMKCLICILFGTALLTSSCKKGDWYDVKSDKSLAVPTTLKDMQALMDNGRIMNSNTPSMKEVASDGHYVSNVIGATLTDTYKNAYTWSHEQRYQIVTDWASASFGSYKKLYYANLVLEGLEKIKRVNQSDKQGWDDIKGQALFHRAFTFYELAQTFGPPYDPNGNNSELSVPIRLESDVNIPSKRSTNKQVYEQILMDLIQAKDLLPNTALYKTRPSKVAVLALLSRIYLSMENYGQAGIYADLTLQSYNTLMDYKTLNANTTTNPIMVYNPEIIFYSSMAFATPLSTTNNLIDPAWYNAYNDNDLRKKIYFNRNVTTGLVTFKGNYCGVGFTDHFSGLTTGEIYLIRAESYARAGKVIEAMKDLNTLVKTRWAVNYTDMVATNADDALIKILGERKKELIMRGLRWSDLRRLNRDSRFVITLTRVVGGITYTLEPNSYKYIFPIPDDIIEMTGLEQNPGW